MCGINLIIDKRNRLGPGPIDKMLEATSHRGPENKCIAKVDGLQNVWLGHNRLKIIDLSENANQPFVSECKRYYLIYNGEIFNFHELRNELLSEGFVFKTKSDTEVLQKILINKNIAAIPLLEGMFSFVFYDSKTEETILARDRHGIKPLYYFNNDEFLIASSETKAITASGLAQKELNEKQILYYLKYRHALAPETFFKNIFTVLPGNYILHGRNGIAFHQYTQTKNSPLEEKFHDPSSVVQKTEDLLIDAIAKHLYADVPQGIFLSGGVDSTLLLALIKKAGLPMIPSFSIVHKEGEKSFGTEDYKFAKKAAEQYGSYHYELEIDFESLNFFNTFIEKTDQPVGDSAAFLTYLLSKEAKKSVGVILSGAGADEVFAGYHRHEAFAWYLKNRALLAPVIPIIKKTGYILPSGINHPFRKYFQLLQKFINKIEAQPVKTLSNFASLDILKNGQLHDDGMPEIGKNLTNEEFLKAALKFDKDFYLVSDILCLTDQMSMLSALEIRVPYLDNNLVSYAEKLSASFKLSKGRKWILNEILNANGGKVFARRKKEGFGLPFGAWIKKLPPELLSLYGQNNVFLKKYLLPGQVEKLLQDHLNNKSDNTLELWSILVLEAWLQNEFQKQGAAA